LTFPLSSGVLIEPINVADLSTVFLVDQYPICVFGKHS
jgi:hypothetical protein